MGSAMIRSSSIECPPNSPFNLLLGNRIGKWRNSFLIEFESKTSVKQAELLIIL